MKGQQQQPTRGVLPINLSNRKAKGTGSMSRAQMKSMAYNEKQKVKKRLAQKLQLSDSERVPDDLIREYQHRSHLDRLQTLLHSEGPNHQQNNFHGKSARRLPGGLKRNSSNQSARAFEEGKADPLKQLPFNPQRQQVHWLSFSEQGRNQIDLANEVEKFYNYVSLSESERNLRDGMVRDVQEAITSKWQAARVHQFGSHSVGLSIFLSDIDISVLGLGEDGKDATEKRRAADKAIAQAQQQAGTDNHSPSAASSEEVAANGDWDAEEMDDDEDEDGEIMNAETESSSNESGTDGAVYSDEVYEETKRPVEDDAEVGWFVDVKGNPDLLKADEDGSSLSKTPQNGTSDLVVYGVGRKRPLLLDEHEDEKDDDDINDESGDVVSIDDSDEEGNEFEADENGDSRIFTPGFKVEVGQSSTSAKKQGVLLSEDLVVQYRDENSICVVTSSQKKANKPNGKQREIIVVDLVSDDEEAEKQSSEITTTERKKVRSSVMDFSNVFDADQLALPNFGRKPEVKSTESAKLHKFQLSLLRDLLPHLKLMDWIRTLEFRGKAKVPIINFEHKNGLQCDMSIGISTQDTSAVVQRLKDVCGAPFVPLAAFLKVLLYQQNLDKPFTGGLGSFKLYIILAYHLLYNQSMFSTAERKDNNPLGLQLLTFLRYFGSPRNLNQHAEISLPFLSEKISFLQTFQVEKVRRLFEKCYIILHKICKERIHSNNHENNQMSAVEQPDRSYSALGCIIDSFQLSKERTAYLTRSRRYPVLTDAEKDAVAAEILRTLAAKNTSGLHMHVDIEQVKTLNPRMAARLRSYLYADQAFSGSTGNRWSAATLDIPNKRRKIDESSFSIEPYSNSSTFQQVPRPAKAFPLLSKKISKTALRRNDAAVTKYVRRATANGTALSVEVVLKIRDSKLSEGLKLKLLAPDFRPESLEKSVAPQPERVVPQITRKSAEAEKLRMMSVKLKEKLLQLKKQAETTGQASSIEEERGPAPAPSAGPHVQSQSQSHSGLPEPHQQTSVAGKKNKINPVTSTGKDDDGNAFYDDPSSFSCPNPLSQPTIAAHPSSSGKAVVEVGQGKGQNERTETTNSFVQASIVSTVERSEPADTHRSEAPRPPAPASFPPAQPNDDRGSHANRSNGKGKGKDKGSSAFFMMRQSTSKLLKVIDDLDYAIAVRMKS